MTYSRIGRSNRSVGQPQSLIERTNMYGVTPDSSDAPDFRGCHRRQRVLSGLHSRPASYRARSEQTRGHAHGLETQCRRICVQVSLLSIESLRACALLHLARALAVDLRPLSASPDPRLRPRRTRTCRAAAAFVDPSPREQPPAPAPHQTTVWTVIAKISSAIIDRPPPPDPHRAHAGHPRPRRPSDGTHSLYIQFSLSLSLPPSLSLPTPPALARTRSPQRASKNLPALTGERETRERKKRRKK